METTVLGGFMTVPMAVVDGFNSHDEYREYLSWRIEIQVVVSLLVDKSISKGKIKEMAERIGKRSNGFPSQIFPSDLMVMNFNGDGNGMIVCNPKQVLLKVNNLAGNTIDMDQVNGIDNTLGFSNELIRILS